jgi:hypothetical protein
MYLVAFGEARAALIEIGTASGQPREVVSVSVSLRTMQASVLGTQNRIEFDRDTPVAALPNGEPDCAVNPSIDKDATGFRFLPVGCNPAVDCQSVRVFVLAFDNLEPIADNSVLYTCRIAIAANAALGTHALRNLEFKASAAGGQEVPTTATDGVVEVVEAPVASIDIGSATGAPGTTTTVAVTLSLLTDPPAEVTGVRNDISFDPLTPIAAKANGLPDCTIHPDIDKGPTFSFLPLGCTPGIDCTGVRALILSTSNTAGIPHGATLYTCEVAIAADAPSGTYPLVAAMPQASDPNGEGLPVLASDGSIEVTELLPCVGDCDGDRVVAINELLFGVNIIIGSQPLSECTALDVDADGTAQINELIGAVNNALNGCPAVP